MTHYQDRPPRMTLRAPLSFVTITPLAPRGPDRLFPATVDDGQNLNAFAHNPVNDPVAFAESFPEIVVAHLGNRPSESRKCCQPYAGQYQLFDDICSVIFGVPGDVVAN